MRVSKALATILLGAAIGEAVKDNQGNNNSTDVRQHKLVHHHQQQQQQQTQDKGKKGNSLGNGVTGDARNGQENPKHVSNKGLRPLPGSFQAAAKLEPLPDAANGAQPHQGQQILKPLPGFQNSTATGQQRLLPLGPAPDIVPVAIAAGNAIDLSRLMAEAASLSRLLGAALAAVLPAIAPQEAKAVFAQLEQLPGAPTAAPSAAPVQLPPLPGAISPAPVATAPPAPQTVLPVPGMILPPPAATPVVPVPSLEPILGTGPVLASESLASIVTLTALSGAQIQTALPQATAATSAQPAQVAGASRTDTAGGAALMAGIIGVIEVFLI